jgi:CBS domain-containing protein
MQQWTVRDVMTAEVITVDYDTPPADVVTTMTTYDISALAVVDDYERDSINQRLQSVIDEITSAWGVKVTLVEVKDVELPDTMRRAMARQAEAERERRAKVIHAAGEFEAAGNLGRAAQVLEQHPAAMQLRVLSTMAELTSERSSTLIFPLPVELLRLVDTLQTKLSGTPVRSDTASRADGFDHQIFDHKPTDESRTVQTAGK